MATIESTETVVVTGSRTYVPDLTVNGTLEVQGTVTVSDTGTEFVPKSRAEGEYDLIVRADGLID
jgi:hypothetical protein